MYLSLGRQADNYITKAVTHMMQLRYSTEQAWLAKVLSNFDDFLVDHAAAEKKASGMAISMLSHYPDKPELVKVMIDLSIEEMMHFREVVKLMTARGLQLQADTRDAYVNQLRKHMRQGTEVYMLDRLVVGGIIEARGCERFGLVADALAEGELKTFYCAITESELRHKNVFIDLAKRYFKDDIVEKRVNELLDIEAEICADLPIVAALH